jgi:hypothetical protein
MSVLTLGDYDQYLHEDRLKMRINVILPKRRGREGYGHEFKFIKRGRVVKLTDTTPTIPLSEVVFLINGYDQRIGTMFKPPLFITQIPKRLHSTNLTPHLRRLREEAEGMMIWDTGRCSFYFDTELDGVYFQLLLTDITFN